MNDIEIQERIIAVAVRRSDGQVFVERNCHAELLNVLYGYGNRSAEQGFLTNKDRFVDRKEALQIAIQAKQIIKKHGNSDELYSEDLFLDRG